MPGLRNADWASLRDRVRRHVGSTWSQVSASSPDRTPLLISRIDQEHRAWRIASGLRGSKGVEAIRTGLAEGSGWIPTRRRGRQQHTRTTEQLALDHHPVHERDDQPPRRRGFRDVRQVRWPRPQAQTRSASTSVHARARRTGQLRRPVRDLLQQLAVSGAGGPPGRDRDCFAERPSEPSAFHCQLGDTKYQSPIHRDRVAWFHKAVSVPRRSDAGRISFKRRDLQSRCRCRLHVRTLRRARCARRQWGTSTNHMARGAVTAPQLRLRAEGDGYRIVLSPTARTVAGALAQLPIHRVPGTSALAVRNTKGRRVVSPSAATRATGRPRARR